MTASARQYPVAYDQLDGLILGQISGRHADDQADHQLYFSAAAKGVPLVLINGYTPDLPARFVSCDDRYAAELAVRHLASLGHTRIGCLVGPSRYVPVRNRMDEFSNVIASLGLSGEIVEAGFSVEGGHRGARKLLKAGVTGIVAASDLLALGAVRATRDAHLRVPEDVSVIGFDDTPLMAFTDPPLTTVRQPVAPFAKRQCIRSSAARALTGTKRSSCSGPNWWFGAPQVAPRRNEATPARLGRSPSRRRPNSRLHYGRCMARAMVPEDLYLLRQVTDCALHPGGVRVAFTVTWADKQTDSNRSELWLHDGTGVRQLSFGHAAHSPQFSADGRWLAYLSRTAKAAAQLHVLPLDGGEPIVIAPTDDAVTGFVWLPDSSGLVLTAVTRPERQRGKSAEELATTPEPRRISSTQYRYNGRGWVQDRWTHLFLARLTVEGTFAPAVRLTNGTWDDDAPSLSPDGTSLAFLSARHADREWVGGNDIWVMPTNGGKPKRVTKDGAWIGMKWRADGKQLVAIGKSTRATIGLYGPHLVRVDGTRQPLPIGDQEVSCTALLARPAIELNGDELLTHGIRRGATHIDRYGLKNGDRTIAIDGQRTIGPFSISGSGRVVFVASGTNTPTELYESVDGVERKLTSVSAPFLRQVALAPMTEAVIVASDGTPVQVFVCAPRGRVRKPGLLYIHGGPLSHYGWGFNSEFQIAASAGYVVVGPNPRGSDGYGHAHAGAIAGDFGNLDWIDVQAAADYLAKRSDVDASQLGIGGGSYGGFMTAWATARTHRFRAALVERAVINWLTMEATSDIGWFIKQSLDTDSFTNPVAMQRQSPLSYVADVQTPTLIVHSEEDWRCPIEQGEQWFAGLRRAGVPTEFVRFPGENHELTRSGRPSLRIERFRIVHEWFARYLPGADFGQREDAMR